MNASRIPCRYFASRGAIIIPRRRNFVPIQNPNGSYSYIPTEFQSISNTLDKPVIAPDSPTKPFTISLYRIIFRYCSHSGDSKGMKDYLKECLLEWARQNPTIECIVRPILGRRPILWAFYLQGNSQRQICVKNLSKEEIQKKVDLLHDLTGPSEKERFHEHVQSTTPSVRPIWDPWHHSNVMNPLMNPKEYQEWKKQQREEKQRLAIGRKAARESLFPKIQ